MATFIPFTNNYQDRSTRAGFQYEFLCDRCGDGIRSSFQPSAMGTASMILNAGSTLLGSLWGAAGTVDRIHDATWERSHDAAFQRASQEVQPHFTRCTRCTGYVCRACWNEQFGLCAHCAPDTAGELAATRSVRSLEQMREQVYATTQFSGNITAHHVTCPTCGDPAGDMKFCSACGTDLSLRQCRNGHVLGPGMRFCGECGMTAE